jgi:hypothetical protein
LAPVGRYISRNRICLEAPMARTAYLIAQLAAALRLGEAHAARCIERALYGCMPAWVAAALLERLQATPQPPTARRLTELRPCLRLLCLAYHPLPAVQITSSSILHTIIIWERNIIFIYISFDSFTPLYVNSAEIYRRMVMIEEPKERKQSQSNAQPSWQPI